MRLLLWALLLTGVVCLSQAEAFWQSRDSNYNKSIVAGGGNQTALDTHAVGTIESSGTTCAVTLPTTSGTNELVVVYAAANGSSAIGATATDTAGLFSTATARSILATNQGLVEFSALSASVVTSDVITITFNQTISYCIAGAFSISGVNTSSLYDTGGPQTSLTDPVSITTTNANDFIWGIFRLAANATDPGGACCTLIDSASGSFMVAEYVKKTATGTYSININAVGGSNGAIADAAKSK